MNKKTIKTIINALQIAKEVTQISYSENQLKCRLTSPGSSNDPFFLENQTDMIDSIEDYEKLIGDFRELATRQDYSLSEE